MVQYVCSRPPMNSSDSPLLLQMNSLLQLLCGSLKPVFNHCSSPAKRSCRVTVNTSTSMRCISLHMGCACSVIQPVISCFMVVRDYKCPHMISTWRAVMLYCIDVLSKIPFKLVPKRRPNLHLDKYKQNITPGQFEIVKCMWIRLVLSTKKRLICSNFSTAWYRRPSGWPQQCGKRMKSLHFHGVNQILTHRFLCRIDLHIFYIKKSHYNPSIMRMREFIRLYWRPCNFDNGVWPETLHLSASRRPNPDVWQQTPLTHSMLLL